MQTALNIIFIVMFCLVAFSLYSLLMILQKQQKINSNFIDLHKSCSDLHKSRDGVIGLITEQAINNELKNLK